MILVKSSLDLIEIEAAILNSDPNYNRVARGKEIISIEEIRAEIQESLEIGAERYLLQVQQDFVGILEFLMTNPGDGYTWLGLLEIKKEHQSKGYGYKALNLFYNKMRERRVTQFRLGVISDNEPGHLFWKRQGMKPVKVTTADDKEVVVYEKHL